MTSKNERLTVLITSFLEPEYVEQLRKVAPDRLEIIADQSIWPPQRYVADHHGPSGYRLPDEVAARYRDYLQRATILWDFPELLLDGQDLSTLAPNVRWVQTTSAGVGQYVARLGLIDSDLIVTTSSGVHANALAEFVMLCLLSHVKLLPMLQADQAAHRWERFCSDTLEGKTMAIVGPGRIGRQIAKVARAFDMRVTGLARDTRPERAPTLGLDQLFDRDHLHEMLGEADAVVVCCPHTPETDNLIDRSAFEAMKPGVMFVNISRGQVVDEDALIDHIRSGRIAFAGLDVFRREPLPAESPLWDLDNVLIDPHSASTAFNENAKIVEIFTHNLHCYLDGNIEDMRNVLDKERMY